MNSESDGQAVDTDLYVLRCGSAAPPLHQCKPKVELSHTPVLNESLIVCLCRWLSRNGNDGNDRDSLASFDCRPGEASRPVLQMTSGLLS